MINWKEGDEVEVVFMGKITETYLHPDGEIRYKVDAGLGMPMGVLLKENHLHPLPTPENMKG